MLSLPPTFRSWRSWNFYLTPAWSQFYKKTARVVYVAAGSSTQQCADTCISHLMKNVEQTVIRRTPVRFSVRKPPVGFSSRMFKSMPLVPIHYARHKRWRTTRSRESNIVLNSRSTSLAYNQYISQMTVPFILIQG